MDIAKTIKQKRLERKWSQQTLAQIAGIHVSIISRTERGASKPSLDTIIALCNALDINPFKTQNYTTLPAHKKLKPNTLACFQEQKLKPASCEGMLEDAFIIGVVLEQNQNLDTQLWTSREPTHVLFHENVPTSHIGKLAFLFKDGKAPILPPDKNIHRLNANLTRQTVTNAFGIIVEANNSKLAKVILDSVSFYTGDLVQKRHN
jgi:transcriptional regulator with XRE-family HTH domain